MKELKELQENPPFEFVANPLAADLFEWHFTLRGPSEGGFEGGRYHGRLIFPFDYPFKPPDIAFLTPNGRFEVGKKICLSITRFHPEHWRPAWGVRTALIAISGFFITKSEGAIGALDWTIEDRQRAAKQSRTYKCQICSSDNALVLLDDVLPAITSSSDPASDGVAVEQDGQVNPLVSTVKNGEKSHKELDVLAQMSDRELNALDTQSKNEPVITPLIEQEDSGLSSEIAMLSDQKISQSAPAALVSPLLDPRPAVQDMPVTTTQAASRLVYSIDMLILIAGIVLAFLAFRMTH